MKTGYGGLTKRGMWGLSYAYQNLFNTAAPANLWLGQSELDHDTKAATASYPVSGRQLSGSDSVIQRARAR